MSSAAEPGAAWAQLSPDRRLINSCCLAGVVIVVAAHAIAGIVFGCLPFFVLTGFAMLQGLPAMLAALATLALAVSWGTHLVQRHHSGATRRSCVLARKAALKVAGVFALAALGLVLLAMAFDIAWLAKPIGVAPRADWMLAPLPWAWRLALPYAHNQVVPRLIFVGLVAALLAAFFIKKLPWPRGATFLLGIALCMLGAYFLGDAAYQYAAARALSGLASEELVQALRNHPGEYNAWTFVCWWGGWSALAVGFLMFLASAVLPKNAFDHID